MSDNVKTVEQFLETARLETGDVWMDNHDWRHLIEMVEQLAAERDALERAFEREHHLTSGCIPVLGRLPQCAQQHGFDGWIEPWIDFSGGRWKLGNVFQGEGADHCNALAGDNRATASQQRTGTEGR